MFLGNPALAEIINAMPNTRISAAQRLVRLSRSMARRNKDDAAIADSIIRIIKNPTLGRPLRDLLKQIANEQSERN